jgi:hypothetical protein
MPNVYLLKLILDAVQRIYLKKVNGRKAQSLGSSVVILVRDQAGRDRCM